MTQGQKRPLNQNGRTAALNRTEIEREERKRNHECVIKSLHIKRERGRSKGKEIEKRGATLRANKVLAKNIKKIYEGKYIYKMSYLAAAGKSALENAAKSTK